MFTCDHGLCHKSPRQHSHLYQHQAGFQHSISRVPCGKWFVKRRKWGLYQSSKKGKELLAGRHTRQH